MINCCIACEKMIKVTRKLCADCTQQWQQSGLSYAFWLITLPSTPQVMAKNAIDTGKAQMHIQDSIAQIFFGIRSCGVVPPADYTTLAATHDKKLW